MIVICNDNSLIIENERVSFTNQKSNKKLIIILFPSIFVGILLAIFLYFSLKHYYKSRKTSNSRSEDSLKKHNKNPKLVDEKKIKHLEIGRIIETNKNLYNIIEKEINNVLLHGETTNFPEVYSNLLEKLKDNIESLFCVDRLFYEENEINVQNDIKKYFSTPIRSNIINDITSEQKIAFKNYISDIKEKISSIKANIESVITGIDNIIKGDVFKKSITAIYNVTAIDNEIKTIQINDIMIGLNSIKDSITSINSTVDNVTDINIDNVKKNIDSIKDRTINIKERTINIKDNVNNIKDRIITNNDTVEETINKINIIVNDISVNTTKIINDVNTIYDTNSSCIISVINDIITTVENGIINNISNIRRNIDITISSIKNSSISHKEKSELLSNLAKDLYYLYKKYKEIYETYNSPKNYATIRNMCIIQIIIVLLNNTSNVYSKEKDERKVLGVAKLVSDVHYSSCIKEIMEVIAAQENSFVSWIYRTLLNKRVNSQNEFVKKEDVIYNTLLLTKESILSKKESHAILNVVNLNLNILKRIYRENAIIDDTKDFSKYISYLSETIKEIDKEKEDAFFEDILKKVNEEDYENYKKGRRNGSIIWKSQLEYEQDKIILDLFENYTDTEYVTLEVQKNRKEIIQFDKKALLLYAINSILYSRNYNTSSYGFYQKVDVLSKRLSGYNSATSICTYPNLIYGGHIPDGFKDLGLVKNMMRLEYEIQEIMEAFILSLEPLLG